MEEEIFNEKGEKIVMEKKTDKNGNVIDLKVLEIKKPPLKNEKGEEILEIIGPNG